MDTGNQTRKDNGVEHHRVSVLELVYNHETHQVSIGGLPMPLSLAQMIAGEGLRVLEEQRRIAAAQMLARTMEQMKRDQAIADAVRRGR
jgi:hypothetical protein